MLQWDFDRAKSAVEEVKQAFEGVTRIPVAEVGTLILALMDHVPPGSGFDSRLRTENPDTFTFEAIPAPPSLSPHKTWNLPRTSRRAWMRVKRAVRYSRTFADAFVTSEESTVLGRGRRHQAGLQGHVSCHL
jgi:hypothetical protein